MENKINSLEERIRKLEELINKNSKELQHGKIPGIINNIIKDNNEANDLKKLLFGNDNVKFKLLFQATRDGDQIPVIEKKICNFSPTLFLIYSKKGVKCGGFTKEFWKLDKGYKNDKEAFLFNLNNKKLFHVKNPNQAIIMDAYCICFGELQHSDFYIRDRFLSERIYEASKKVAYYSEGYDVIGENESFLNELEIYHVTFN